jgi:hypothetical protein
MEKIIYFSFPVSPSYLYFLPFYLIDILSFLFVHPGDFRLFFLSPSISFTLKQFFVTVLPSLSPFISFPLSPFFIFPSYRRSTSRIGGSAEDGLLFPRVVVTARCAFPKRECVSIVSFLTEARTFLTRCVLFHILTLGSR